MREIAYDIWHATHRLIDTVLTRYQPVRTISSLDQLIEPALEVHGHVIATSHIRSTGVIDTTGDLDTETVAMLA